VAAYDLVTARRVGFFDLQSVKDVKNVADLPSFSGRREYTVTVADNRIYAALGGTVAQSTLVCLNLPPQPDGQLHLRWHRLAGESTGEDKGSTAFWEGAPIAADNQLFIARTRTDKNPSLTLIECYDADTGQPRWKREICFVQDSSGAGSHSHLLTLAGPNLVYNSDAGVVVAIDAATGRRAWACRYPSRGLKTNNGDPSPRGLSPVVYQSGRVLVAPADYEGLLCLDALTGEKIWERNSIEVVHLLGVAKGRLIFTTAQSNRHAAVIRALDAATGADLRRWIQPEDGTSLLSYGKGFLAGDHVFWPTFNRQTHEPVLYVLNQDGGQIAVEPTQFWQVHCGNMAFGKGCLAVADQENLHVYVPPARLLEQRENHARKSGSATASYRLAEALADAGQSAKALEVFEQAAKLIRPNDASRKTPLLQKVRTEQHRLLLSLAEQAITSHQLNAAKDFLKQAGGIEFDISDRLRAHFQLVETMSSTEPNQALAICKDILQDEALSGGWLIASDGTRRQAKWWAAEHGDRLSPKDADRRQPPAKSSFAIRELSNERLGKSEGETDSSRLRPRWQIPLTPSWQITLDREETFFGVTDGADRCLLTCRGQDLICREFMSERPRWVQKLALTPTWFSTWGDGCLTGSSQEIRLLNLSDGRILWSLSAPPTIPSGDAEERELRQFQLVGSVLIFFQGQRHLFGVDVQTGRVIWQHQAPSASLRLPPPAGKFFPCFYAGEKGILVQTSGGRFWIIDPYTGKLTGEGPTSSSPWPRSPIPLGCDRVAIVADSQSVMLLSLPGGSVIWKKTLGQPSMTAQAPQLVWNGQSLCQLVDGWRLARLDLINGKEGFEKAISTEPINADLGTWDADCLYYVSRGILHARSLTSARLIWERPLPRLSVPWRVVDLDKHLLLMPSQPPFTLRWGFFLNPRPMSFPVEIQWDDVTLLLCDKETGKVAQQWAIHGTQSPIRVQISNHALVVTVGGRLLVCQPSSVR
jgi:outer membrane protein assembly factor BamB